MALRKTAGNSGRSNVRDNNKDLEMRQLYNSEYTGIPAYLMDFGFGGFLGYGKGMSERMVVEELKKG